MPSGGISRKDDVCGGGSPDRVHYHYARVGWRQADIAQHDLEPAPHTLQRDHQERARSERHFALPVVGQSGVHDGVTLGILAVRCERHQDWVLPMTLAIADAELCANAEQVMAAVQSNPRRWGADE